MSKKCKMCTKELKPRLEVCFALNAVRRVLPVSYAVSLQVLEMFIGIHSRHIVTREVRDV
jgi:hypothetical protein